LSNIEPCIIYALANTAERNYSNVHTAVNRLEELGLIERTEEDKISVPFESIEIFMPLAKAA
ncbi:MAG: transcriptional regulator, partial [Dolichospermum sp.]